MSDGLPPAAPHRFSLGEVNAGAPLPFVHLAHLLGHSAHFALPPSRPALKVAAAWSKTDNDD